MGCKSPVACNDNKKQNFKGKWANRQCKPWNWGTLVSLSFDLIHSWLPQLIVIATTADCNSYDG